MAHRLAGGNPPEVDEGDPESIRRYRKWRSSYTYNSRNRAQRNDAKRVKMQALRAKQALEPLRIQAARLEAKRKSAAKYRDTHRERLAMQARQRRERAHYKKRATFLKSLRRAAAERRALNTAVADLEPLESEGEDCEGAASD